VKTLGRHVIAEIYGCEEEILNNQQAVEELMLNAARKIGAQVVDTVFHKFNPHGISGVVVIAESHLAIHTWPEYGYAAVDFFTCGEEIDPWMAHQYVAQALKAKNLTAFEMKRGWLNLPVEKLRHKPKLEENKNAGGEKRALVY